MTWFAPQRSICLFARSEDQRDDIWSKLVLAAEAIYSILEVFTESGIPDGLEGDSGNGT